MRKTDRTTKHIETQKTIKRQNQKKREKQQTYSNKWNMLKRTCQKTGDNKNIDVQ